MQATTRAAQSQASLRALLRQLRTNQPPASAASRETAWPRSTIARVRNTKQSLWARPKKKRTNRDMAREVAADRAAKKEPSWPWLPACWQVRTARWRRAWTVRLCRWWFEAVIVAPTRVWIRTLREWLNGTRWSSAEMWPMIRSRRTRARVRVRCCCSRRRTTRPAPCRPRRVRAHRKFMQRPRRGESRAGKCRQCRRPPVPSGSASFWRSPRIGKKKMRIWAKIGIFFLIWITLHYS